MPEQFTMDNCRYCETAIAKPDFPVFNARCSGCAIRGWAQSPHFWRAEAKMGSEDYKKALIAQFGADNWKAAHVEIMMEAQRIRKHREHESAQVPALSS